MSALKEKIGRRLRNGGVLDNVPSDAKIRAFTYVDGKRYAVLADGRVARSPRIEWRFYPTVHIAQLD